MAKDELFKTENVNEDFRFTEQVAEVFDDMLARSVPNYQQVTAMTAQLVERFTAPGDTVYDLGCSTGATLLALSRHLGHLNLSFCGIDNSPAMLAKARRKAEMYGKQELLAFIEQDILEAELANAGAVILNYTLQFVRPMQRPGFLAKIHARLKPGGILIMSEKVISHDPLLNRCFIDFYLDFKRGQGYSELEISRKREALENVLIPFSLAENRDLLTQAGFASVETFSQWFNFASFVAIK